MTTGMVLTAWLFGSAAIAPLLGVVLHRVAQLEEAPAARGRIGQPGRREITR